MITTLEQHVAKCVFRQCFATMHKKFIISQVVCNVRYWTQQLLCDRTKICQTHWSWIAFAISCFEFNIRSLKTWTLEERSQYLENQGIVTAKQECSMPFPDWVVFCMLLCCLCLTLPGETYSPGQSDIDISVRTSGGMPSARSMEVLSRWAECHLLLESEHKWNFLGALTAAWPGVQKIPENSRTGAFFAPLLPQVHPSLLYLARLTRLADPNPASRCTHWIWLSVKLLQCSLLVPCCQFRFVRSGSTNCSTKTNSNENNVQCESFGIALIDKDISERIVAKRGYGKIQEVRSPTVLAGSKKWAQFSWKKALLPALA